MTISSLSFRQYLAGILAFVSACGFVAPFAQADDEPAKSNATAAASAKKPEPETPADKTSVTHHTLQIGGTTLKYTATTGFLPVKDDAGKVEANIFFVAYTKDDVSGPEQRPITFAFNGGPGASSVWLHLGALGPKRALLAADGTALPNEYKLVDNESTWLDFTDLVFVDPVGTGYSRAVDANAAKQFYEVPKDIQTAANFIRLYVTRNERWLSPKFVVGESYGTTRAAGLANHLQDSNGLNLSGVILISSALNFETFLFGEENDLPYALVVPTFTAAAWYHKKLPPDLQADLPTALAKSQEWAMTDYLVALGKGATLTDAEHKHTIEQMAKYTGLSTNFLETSRLRVSNGRFIKELLRQQHETIGLMDSRVLGVDVNTQGEYSHFDPAFFLVTGPYVATLNDYLRRELKYETDLPYEYLSREVNHLWKWNSGGQGYTYVADDLAEAMSRDSHLRVFAAAGEYDLTTPFWTQKYTFDHMNLEPSRRQNLTFTVYPSGHQIYTDDASLKKLKADVSAFVTAPR